MCTRLELGTKMREVLINKVNEAGGRRRLCEEVGCDFELISGILDGGVYPTIGAFEHWFGPLGIKDTEVEKPESIRKAAADHIVKENDLPFTIDCPAFEDYKNLVLQTGYKIRIVKK